MSLLKSRWRGVSRGSRRIVTIVFLWPRLPEGEVVGWVQVHFTRWLASDARGEVLGLVVASKMRGRGIGRQLMQMAEGWTKERGGSLVALRSNILRKETHIFYQRLGCEVTKTSLYFKKPL